MSVFTAAGVDLSIYSSNPPDQHHWATVRQRRDRLIICSVHKGTKPCPHKVEWARALNKELKGFKKLNQEYVEAFYGSSRDRYEFVSQCHSSRVIPIPVRWRVYAPGIYDDSEEYPTYDKFSLKSRVSKLSADLIVVKPEEQTCPVCENNTFTSNRHNAKIITLTHIYENVVCEVHTCTNSECRTVIYYDGYEDHLFNVDSETLYCHALLNQYIHSSLSQFRETQ